MARIRTIKPEFFTSEDIVELSAFARLLYISLWCESDKEGRLLWRPKTFKMRYFPADDLDINACAEELVSAGLVRLYGKGLAYIPSFKRHQHINPRESESRLPDPEARVDDASARVTDASARVNAPSLTRREEGKGREGKESSSKTHARARDSVEFQPVPDTINPTAWADWERHRKQRRKPISDRAAREQWVMLSSLTHDQQAECISASIRNDWQGLFPEKFTQPRASPANGTRGRSITEDLTDRSWAQ